MDGFPGGRAIGDPKSKNVFLQPVDEHDAALTESEAERLAALCGHTDWCVVTLPIAEWNTELTPWEAPPVFGRVGFGSGAERTLTRILEETVPGMERDFPAEGRRFFLCGYSLAGLFALWSAYRTNAFAGVAAVSPSVWYPGWTAYAREHAVRTPEVYLSLGDREEKAKNRVMAGVGDAIREQHRLLTEAGIRCTLEWNAGNHFVDSDVRMAKGLAWLLENA